MFDGFIETTAPYMLWIKAAHLFFVMSWMAGMMYFPRLLAYHTEARPGAADYERFIVMERRFMRIIINPSMIGTWIFGLWLASIQGVWGEGWFHAKLFLVVILSGVHGLLSRWRKDFEAGRNVRSQKFFRIINEVPPILLIFILIFVVVKPF
jgi:protoporphyrinogen IX oxidase